MNNKITLNINNLTDEQKNTLTTLITHLGLDQESRLVTKLSKTNTPQFMVMACSGNGGIEWVSVRDTLEQAQEIMNEQDGINMREEKGDACLMIVPIQGFIQYNR